MAGDPADGMARDEWLAAFCERIGVAPPSAAEIDALLELAAIAAHASERPAAPLACWAAGRTGRSPAELREIAREVAPPAEPTAERG
jgi:hypothetical protein